MTEPGLRASRRIVLGTSGYSFLDWIGPFYPAGTERGRMLDFYAREFSAVEVNSTYYRIPPPRTLEGMARRTPPGFQFVVKTHHDMTHERSTDADLYRSFERAIDPLRDSGKLEGFLAQFPYAFRRTPESEAYLRILRDLLPKGVPLFVEFRHDSWAGEDLVPLLESEGLGYVSVDEPDLPGLMPPIARRAGPVGYVRFHGRNKAKWWGPESWARGKPDRVAAASPRKPVAKAGERDLGPLFSGTPEAGAGAALSGQADRTTDPGAASARTSSTRYDYLYSEDELKDWIEKIRVMTEQAKKTFVFFNNCHVGQAATSAKLMRRLLEGEGLL